MTEEKKISISGMEFSPAELRAILSEDGIFPMLLAEAIASTSLSRDEKMQTYTIEDWGDPVEPEETAAVCSKCGTAECLEDAECDWWYSREEPDDEPEPEPEDELEADHPRSGAVASIEDVTPRPGLL